MFGLGRLIDSATRITCQCSSILDLVFVSFSDNVAQSEVLSVGFSDHLIVSPGNIGLPLRSVVLTSSDNFRKFNRSAESRQNS